MYVPRFAVHQRITMMVTVDAGFVVLAGRAVPGGGT
jgi:hypothetical protein